MQGQDSLKPEDMEFTVVSEAQPDERMLQDLKFAWLGVKHVKSNAITVAKDLTLLGMGSGQPNRVKSTQIALEKVRLCAATNRRTDFRWQAPLNAGARALTGRRTPPIPVPTRSSSTGCAVLDELPAEDGVAGRGACRHGYRAAVLGVWRRQGVPLRLLYVERVPVMASDTVASARDH